MADIADRSDDNITNVVADGIARARRELAASLPPIGICHWCLEDVNADQVFCDQDCADDWQHNHDRRKELGL